MKEEIKTEARASNCEWTEACIHYLTRLRIKELSEDGSDEGDEMSLQELFHVETNAFMAKFNFDGSVSYNEVSLALWKRFKEKMNDMASKVDGIEVGLTHDPMDIISSFFHKLK